MLLKVRPTHASVSVDDTGLLIAGIGKHGSAPVSQIYGHKDAGTYPKYYLLHCSSIDTVSAVLGEEDQSGHIKYFQGFESFYEQGFPRELPAEIEAQILQASELTEIRC